VIGVCAPAGPVTPQRLTAALEALASDGYQVVTAPSAFGRHGLFAATDDVRRQELEEMFSRTDVDAVFCARGGVGSSRLLPRLDTSRIARSRKPFLGFSDVTALQWHLFAREGFVSFQGPLAVEWDGGVSPATRTQTFHLLAGDSPPDLLSGLTRDGVRVLRGGQAKGRLMPANLSMITTLLGTPFLPDLRGALLLIEDVNEPAYRVDRMLFHLRNAGVLHQIGALLAGELVAADNAEEIELADLSLREATSGLSYPIVTGLPFGHGPQRMTVPVGAAVELQTDPFRLDLCEPVVREDAA
jgi:muramoyltetrapeptide carboxypeptidase